MLITLTTANAQWENLNTGINDNLTGITFIGNYGFVSGENGVYITTNGGIGASSWSRYTIDPSDSDYQVYENTIFKHCISNDNTGSDPNIVYACGQNTLNNRAVIFRFDLNNMTHDIIYTDWSNNSVLNKLAYDSSGPHIHAVGNQGLVVRIEGTNTTFMNARSVYDDSDIDDDFNTISFRDDYRMYIGSQDKVFYTGNGYNYGSQRFYYSVDLDDVDVKAMDANSYLDTYVVGSDYVRINNNTNIYPRNNFYGDLNANAMININNLHIVGTDHGILKSSTLKGYLEWQPSSGNNNIKDISKDKNDQNIVYACGDNGVVFKSSNLGGSTIPYLALNGTGKCVNSTVNFDLYSGSSNNCTWEINGTVVNSDCDDFSYYFDTVGTYNVSVTGINGDNEQATVSQTIQIVDLPEIDKTISISDTILCKSESITIDIDNSEQNVQYILKKDDDNSTHGISPVGNGGTIQLVSDELTETGLYYLSAKHVQANCQRSFTNQFEIIVEQTEARFVSSLINAEVDETVHFTDLSIDADNFSWDFSNNSTPGNSSIQTPDVSFNDLGLTTVDLTVWSDDGCYDNITTDGPNIVSNESIEDCWTIVQNGVDIYNGQYNWGDFPGFWDPEILDLKPTTDGFLSCGYYNDLVVDSKYGVNFNGLQNKLGSYLAKHNKDGLLKWVVHTENSSRDLIYNIAQDSNNDIYICGFSDDGMFYDNFGNSVELGVNGRGFILKLTSKGELIWHINSSFFPKRLDVDENDNLLVTGDLNSYGNGMYLNGENYTALADVNSGGFQDVNNFVLKLNALGGLLWYTGINTTGPNGDFLEAIGHDANNNIYVTGYASNTVDIYSASSGSYNTLSYPGYSPKLFLVKYNENGQVIWNINSYVNDAPYHSGVKPYSMVVDDDGNCYISGKNDCSNASQAQFFSNTNGTLTSNSVGGFFISKVNTNGVCEWIQGAAHSYYGYGYKVIKSNNEIICVASVSNNSNMLQDVNVLSSDGNNIYMQLFPSDYFLTVYNASGKLKRVVANGVNNDPVFYNKRISGFFKDDITNSYYLSRNIGFFTGGTLTEFQNFGHTIYASDLNEQDGVITKFNESCGLVTLSSNEYEYTTGLEIFPNPTSEILNINAQTPISKVSLYDLNGRLLKEEQINGNLMQHQLDVQNLSNGIYFVEIDSGEKSVSKKFVKR
jgi:hypothetical protein